MAGPTRTKTKTSKAKASAEDMLPGGTLKAAPSGHGTVLRKRGGGWTEEEHRLFLLGLQTYGRGDWRSIARNYVLTRSPSQVASHAQKYFLRLQANAANGGAKRKRKKGRSVLDITTANMYSEGLGESTSSPTKPKSSKKKADLQAKKKELARAIPPPTLEGLPSFAIPSQALVQGSAAAPYLPPPAFGTIPSNPALLGGATATDASSPAAAAAAAVAAANGQMMHPMMQQMQAAAAVASGQPAPQMMMGMAPAAMAAAANSGTGNLSPAQVAQLQQMQMYQLAVYENILKRQNELMVAQQQQQHNAAAAAAVASAAGTLQAGATASNRKRLQSERDQVSESDSDSDDDDDESSDGEDDGERVMEPPSKKRRFSLVASEILINLANGGSYSGSGGNQGAFRPLLRHSAM